MNVARAESHSVTRQPCAEIRSSWQWWERARRSGQTQCRTVPHRPHRSPAPVARHSAVPVFKILANLGMRLTSMSMARLHVWRSANTIAAHLEPCAGDRGEMRNPNTAPLGR